MLKSVKRKLQTALGLRDRLPARVACLGQDIYHAGMTDFGIIENVQKGRVDLLLDWIGGAPAPRPDAVREYVKRADIYDLIQQQATFNWHFEREKYPFLIMDSYSELVDHRFQHRAEGWSFAACYGDVKHSPEFKEKFDHQGLLDLSSIKSVYQSFFECIFAKQPDLKVAFFHFPDAFEKRARYLDRHKAIVEALSELESEWSGRLFSFTLKSDRVIRPDKYRGFMIDENPYHFDLKTAQRFVSLAKERLNI